MEASHLMKVRIDSVPRSPDDAASPMTPPYPWNSSLPSDVNSFAGRHTHREAIRFMSYRHPLRQLNTHPKRRLILGPLIQCYLTSSRSSQERGYALRPRLKPSRNISDDDLAGLRVVSWRIRSARNICGRRMIESVEIDNRFEPSRIWLFALEWASEGNRTPRSRRRSKKVWRKYARGPRRRGLVPGRVGRKKQVNAYRC